MADPVPNPSGASAISPLVLASPGWVLRRFSSRVRFHAFRLRATSPSRSLPRQPQAEIPLTGRLPDGGSQGSFCPMSTVGEIKAAIPKLALEERAEVARCLPECEDAAWDR